MTIIYYNLLYYIVRYFTRKIMAFITILSPDEEKIFNSPPKLNFQQQQNLFTLPKLLIDKILSFQNDDNRIVFMLIYGYFKVTHKFYEKNMFRKEDIEFLQKDNSFIADDIFSISQIRIRQYEALFKGYFGIKIYSKETEKRLQELANNLANSFVNRMKIFYELVSLSKKLHLEIPSYTELSKIITIALNAHKKDILEKLALKSNDENLKILNDFTEKNQDNLSKYNIAYYKKLEHGTKKNQMSSSLLKFNEIRKKFNAIEKTCIDIGITPKVAQYYAKWIEKSQTSQLTQMNKLNQQFSLLSFVYYQYHIRDDNLIDRFIFTVQSAKNSAFRAQKDYSYEQEPQKNEMIKSLENTTVSTLDGIKLILKDATLSAIQKVASIEKLVTKQSIALEAIQIQEKLFGDTTQNKYDFIEKRSASLQGKLSQIVKTIEFDEDGSNKHILSAIKYFKENPTITNKAPKGFLNDEEKKAIFGKKLRGSLYKVLLFFHMSDLMKTGDLNLKYSYRYKDFEKYLIGKEEWELEKDALMELHGFTPLKDCKKFLEPLKEAVEENFKITNDNIKDGKNIYFIATSDSFILKTPKLEKEEDAEESIGQYLPKEYLSIIDIMFAVDKEVDFLSLFQHYSQNKLKSNHNLLLASILGYGCNITISKIGKISKGINENQLDNTKTWYFSEENTMDANDKIVAFMENLEFVKIMRNDENKNHTSSDGQKYDMKSNVDSTNAGYSAKYFGIGGKGVTAYTSIDESHRLYYSTVISVNERESGYVIDGLLHNETVESTIFSTDSHGFSEVIFGLTHLLGVMFAPRIKHFKDQQLYGINLPKSYQNLDYTLVPKRKINFQLIEDNWDDILRFMVTVKERQTTVSLLLKRLTSRGKQHKLYSALQELGRLVKTNFLLQYIDQVVLRQQVEKQLNKIEASNKFSKAVFFGNNQEFTVATIEEQNIANNCKRLIQNAIILWNYLYLTKKHKEAPTEEQKSDIVKTLKQSSIIHWSHINFYGEYDFTRSSKKVHDLISRKDGKSV